ncbi:hypothetical protein OJ252_3236 [Cryptosporidium canis]|uniref:Uncharacterized protein n=1 Tax=Cryptosporidium canis TaxID=195482 RepID=A0ABQ8P2Z0_9CRYT|nr:hypothetical protein OJ252_3236 [Cryptosporidium canis]
MKLLISVWTCIFALFSFTRNEILNPSVEFSFLGLQASNDNLGRKNARISVNECSSEALIYILAKDQASKFLVTTYQCYVKNLEDAVNTCRRKCKLSRSFGRCKGIEERLETNRQVYENHKQDQARWNSFLLFCVDCRVLIEYQLIQSKFNGQMVKSVGGGHEDPAYTLTNLFKSYISTEMSSTELLYIKNSELYVQLKEKLCKQKKSRALCKCATQTLKTLLDNKKNLQDILHRQRDYQKRCHAHLSRGYNGLPSNGNPIDDIRDKCRDAARLEAEIKGSMEGISNQAYSEEDLNEAFELSAL